MDPLCADKTTCSTPPAQTVCEEPQVPTITVFANQPAQTIWDVDYVTMRTEVTVWVGYVVVSHLVMGMGQIKTVQC